MDTFAGAAKRILVVTDATKELSPEAPLWAIRHLAQAGDTLRLLGILQQVHHPSSSQKLAYKSRIEPGMFGAHGQQEEEIKKIFDANNEYFAQLKNNCEKEQIDFSTAIIPGFPVRSVLLQAASQFHANWIVLDRLLKKEKKQLTDMLHCSLAIIDKTGTGRVIQFAQTCEEQDPSDCFDLPEACLDATVEFPSNDIPVPPAAEIAAAASASLTQPTLELSILRERQGELASDITNSDDFFSGHGILSSAKSFPALQMLSPDVQLLPTVQPSGVSRVDLIAAAAEGATAVVECQKTADNKSAAIAVQPRRASAMDMLKLLDGQTELEEDPFVTVEQEEKMLEGLHTKTYSRSGLTVDVNKGLRLPSSTPLCSLCNNNKSPRFGTKPCKFPYSEIEEATNQFSSENLLAEGGFGFVYKGRLKDGQLVAAKQLKLASTQGDKEFYAEVEVLSSARHRNLVTLIGYCVEGGRRILVYEYVCNNSLHWHLQKSSFALDWSSRQKAALGAARGLRYLHEECRIGCIVHRDMRPNNILLTHDFSALVGDFGLARWQARGDEAEQTRVIGTIGYVAPEYAETGQITDKADVFSFGLVLLELITGRPAFDHGRSEHLLEWALPLLESRATHELVDMRLDESTVDGYELVNMVNAAHQCVQKDPANRPRMSQVVRILEGEDTETTPLSPVVSLDTPPYMVRRKNKQLRISYSEMLR